MAFDSPIGFTTYYNLKKFALSANPGADALNDNLDAIDTAINEKEDVISFNYPLSRSGDIVSLLINNTNLKLISNALNTIQDIAVSSNVQFAKQGIGGSAPSVTYISKIYGSENITGDLVVDGNLTINGDTVVLNAYELDVEDKNIVLGNVVSPTDTTANGGGISLLGATTKSIIYDSTYQNWTSSEHVNVASGKSYKVNNTIVIDSSRNFSGVGITLSGLIDQNGTGTNTFNGALSSDTFVSGYFGLGWKLWNDSAGANGELDNLVIRNFLRTHIFQKDIVRATNGYLFISDVSEIIAESATTDANKYIYCKENVFQVGDILWYKDVADDGSVISGIKITVSALGGLVTLPGGGTKTGYRVTYTLNSGSGTFKAGGTIVRVGSSVAGRQGSIYFDASSSLSPFMDIYDGVISWSDFQSIDKIVLRAGKLDGITDLEFGSLSGYGLYTNKGYFTSDVIISGVGVGMLNGMTALFHFDDSVLDSFSGVKPVYNGTFAETSYGLITSSGGGIVATRGSGKFGGGIAVEEGTTNTGANTLFTSSTSWTNYVTSSATGTRTFNTLTGDVFYKTGLRLTKTDAGAGRWGVYQTNAAWNNAQHTFTFRFKIASKSAGALLTFASGIATLLQLDLSSYDLNTWYAYTVTTSSANDSRYIAIQNAPADVLITAFQAEAKAYATSYCEGTRAAGTLEYNGIITPSSFSIKTNIYVDFNKSQTSGRLFEISKDTNNRLFVAWNVLNTLNFTLRKSGSDLFIRNSSAVTIAAGWHEFNIVFNGSSYELFVDSISYASANISTQIDSDWTLKLGYGAGGFYSNTIHDELAIFNRTLTAKEIQKIYYSNQPFNESSGMTYISGNHIKTGILTSENWISLTSGSAFDLNKGYLELNNGTTNLFKFDSSNATAKISAFDFTDKLLSNSTYGINFGDYTNFIPAANTTWLGARDISGTIYRDFIMFGSSTSIYSQMVTAGGKIQARWTNGTLLAAIGDLSYSLTDPGNGFGFILKNGGDILFKVATDENRISAFSFDKDKLYVSTDFVLDATNKKWYFNNKNTYSVTTAGIFMGLDSGVYKFNVGNATKYIKWDGSNLDTAGATITGGILQTATSGQRIIINGTTNIMSFYPSTLVYPIKLWAQEFSSSYTVLEAINDNTTTYFRVGTGVDANSRVYVLAAYQNSQIIVTGDNNSHNVILNAGASSAYISINGSQVLGTRQTGWTTSSGTANKGTFNADSATLLATSQRVKALEDVMRAHGLIN